MVEIILNRDTDTDFPFGKAWRSSIEIADDARIAAASDSLREALHIATLSRRTFLDVGCRSGLLPLPHDSWVRRSARFALTRIRSQATVGLRRRFAVDSDWLIKQGSVLDSQFGSSLGRPWMRRRDWSHRSFNTHCRGS